MITSHKVMWFSRSGGSTSLARPGGRQTSPPARLPTLAAPSVMAGGTRRTRSRGRRRSNCRSVIFTRVLTAPGLGLYPSVWSPCSRRSACASSSVVVGVVSVSNLTSVQFSASCPAAVCLCRRPTAIAHLHVCTAGLLGVRCSAAAGKLSDG